MKIDTEKLSDVLKQVGGLMHGRSYSETSVTVGEVDGVVYRIVAMDSMMAEDKECADGPDWARCVVEA